MIYILTYYGNTELRVDLEDWNGDTSYAKYGRFYVKKYNNIYTVDVGSYTGTAGDSLAQHNGMNFTTIDADNDLNTTKNCASGGGWWFNNCSFCNLNGEYVGDAENIKGITWYHWKNNWQSMKKASMMIRRPT